MACYRAALLIFGVIRGYCRCVLRLVAAARTDIDVYVCVWCVYVCVYGAQAAVQMLGPAVAGHPVWNLRCKVPDNEEATVPWHQGVV